MKWSLLIAALLLAAVPSEGRADGRNETARGCEDRQPSALGKVSCEVGLGLPKATGPLLVVVSEVSSDQHAERTEALARRLATLVAGELGPQARASERMLDAASAQRTARGVDLVVLNARLGRDRFAVDAELIPGARRFWERFRPGLVGASAHAHAARAPDAELMGYLPPIPLVLSRIDKASALEEPSVAVACGDVDGDGALEIVQVGRRKILLGRLNRGKFQVTASVPWAELSRISARPLREPIASAAVYAGAGLEVGLSDRAEALRLDPSLRVVARFPGRIPWPSGGCANLTATGLSPERAPCAGPAASREPESNIDTLAGARVVRRDGSALSVFASRRSNGQLELEFAGRRVAVPSPAVGAQLALGDLDGDGKPELLSTLDTSDPSHDALVVRTLSESGALHEAFRFDVPSGVRSLAVCPHEGSALAPVVLGTGDGLWVAR